MESGDDAWVDRERRRLNSAPFIAAVEARGGIAKLTEHHGTRERERRTRAYYRARARGWIDVGVADDLVTHILDDHPSSLWGTDWYDIEPGAAHR